MLPDGRHPERGRFVRDQVDALRGLGELQVELYEFAPGARALLQAGLDLRARYRGERFDVVHAHFGLTAWATLAVKARGRALTVHGTDIRHPRTRLATCAVLPSVGLLAAVSQALVEEIPGRRARARAQVLPCGVDMERFVAVPRAHAWGELNLDPQPESRDPRRSGYDPRSTRRAPQSPNPRSPNPQSPNPESPNPQSSNPQHPYLLFPADPSRPEKRYDRAKALADSVGANLLTLGGVDPERVPLYVNGANAVIVPSAREGFGLAVLEALACDVPVLATPVGIHASALDGVSGTLCAPFELERWRAALEPLLASKDPRVEGRASAERFSARAMAERVAASWRSLVAEAG
jgi:teichuronic acid biosynthesis glycosyltransferase TuaC